MRPLLLLSRISVLLTAQQVTRQPTARRQPADPNRPQLQAQPTDPAGLCTIEGQVVDTESGAPIRKANPGRKAALAMGHRPARTRPPRNPIPPGFNEAAADRLRKPGDADARNVHRLASMRPQPIGCGNQVSDARLPSEPGASMRPQPIGCGNGRQFSGDFPQAPRFNEAAADRLRKRFKSTPRNQPNQLQ